MNNIIFELWNLAKNLVEGIGDIWSWLNNELLLGFDVPIVGYVGLPGFVPLHVIGAGMVGIIVFWLIKGLVPFL